MRLQSTVHDRFLETPVHEQLTHADGPRLIKPTLVNEKDVVLAHTLNNEVSPYVFTTLHIHLITTLKIAHDHFEPTCLSLLLTRSLLLMRLLPSPTVPPLTSCPIPP